MSKSKKYGASSRKCLTQKQVLAISDSLADVIAHKKMDKVKNIDETLSEDITIMSFDSKTRIKHVLMIT